MNAKRIIIVCIVLTQTQSLRVPELPRNLEPFLIISGRRLAPLTILFFRTKRTDFCTSPFQEAHCSLVVVTEIYSTEYIY